MSVTIAKHKGGGYDVIGLTVSEFFFESPKGGKIMMQALQAGEAEITLSANEAKALMRALADTFGQAVAPQSASGKMRCPVCHRQAQYHGGKFLPHASGSRLCSGGGKPVAGGA